MPKSERQKLVSPTTVSKETREQQLAQVRANITIVRSGLFWHLSNPEIAASTGPSKHIQMQWKLVHHDHIVIQIKACRFNFSKNHFPTLRNSVRIQNEHKIGVNDGLIQKIGFYWGLKGARASEHSSIHVAHRHLYRMLAPNKLVNACRAFCRYSVPLTIGTLKIARFCIFNLAKLLLHGHLSTKITFKNWNKRPKHKNLRIGLFYPLSCLNFSCLARGSLVRCLCMGWQTPHWTVIRNTVPESPTFD